MILRLFTPRQPIPDVQPTSQKWILDPEVIVKHDDLYARAWESEYEVPIFDNGRNEPNNYNSTEITVRHDLANDEKCNIPGNIREHSSEIFLEAYEVGDGTDTDHYVEPDAETYSEQLNPTNVNPHSTKYDLGHNP